VVRNRAFRSGQKSPFTRSAFVASFVGLTDEATARQRSRQWLRRRRRQLVALSVFPDCEGGKLRRQARPDPGKPLSRNAHLLVHYVL